MTCDRCGGDRERIETCRGDICEDCAKEIAPKLTESKVEELWEESMALDREMSERLARMRVTRERR